jgi:hypothetical protein
MAQSLFQHLRTNGFKIIWAFILSIYTMLAEYTKKGRFTLQLHF